MFGKSLFRSLAFAAFAAAIAFLFWMGDSLGERHRSALAQHKEPPAMDPPDDAGTRAEDILAAIEADGAPGVARGIEFLRRRIYLHLVYVDVRDRILDRE